VALAVPLVVVVGSALAVAAGSALAVAAGSALAVAAGSALAIAAGLALAVAAGSALAVAAGSALVVAVVSGPQPQFPFHTLAVVVPLLLETYCNTESSGGIHLFVRDNLLGFCNGLSLFSARSATKFWASYSFAVMEMST